MGTKMTQGAKKKAKKPIRTPRPPVVRLSTVIGDPSIEGIEDGRHIVLWMDVHGHGRIKVESRSPGVYRSSAADPNAASAAEAGAGAYCEQHGEQLRELYDRLA
jgi:hypothetical protein